MSPGMRNMVPRTSRPLFSFRPLLLTRPAHTMSAAQIVRWTSSQRWQRSSISGAEETSSFFWMRRLRCSSGPSFWMRSMVRLLRTFLFMCGWQVPCLPSSWTWKSQRLTMQSYGAGLSTELTPGRLSHRSTTWFSAAYKLWSRRQRSQTPMCWRNSLGVRTHSGTGVSGWLCGCTVARTRTLKHFLRPLGKLARTRYSALT
mmetsp:Transcript_62440/g.165697  ORF Transcript_62440/g.165697 Transcript_62440/m.165697 type:complete len:201 (-) Transcript_62440:859-1461(-)